MSAVSFQPDRDTQSRAEAIPKRRPKENVRLPATQPASFGPARPVAFVVATLVALVLTVFMGITISIVATRLVGAVIRAPAHSANWMRPALWAGYIVFLLTVVAPFLLFLAWNLAGSYARHGRWRGRLPRVTILIPAYNEQEIILDAIHAALGQVYPDFEVLVIDDGSSDLTSLLTSTMPVRLIRLERNVGKAASLNHGIREATGEVIVTCDADSYLDSRALRYLVRRMADPTVGAVAGQVRLFHPKGMLRRFQVLEYDYNQAIIKRAQRASTGSVLIAPGPVSAFRADVLRAIGGVPTDTLTEDFDLTLKIVDTGLRVDYEPRAVAFTDAPQSDSALRRQRVRWARGGLQVTWKHLGLIGDRRLGLFGLIWLPYQLASWVIAAPMTILALLSVPLFAWGSVDPGRMLVVLGLYGLVGLAIESLKTLIGLLASDLKDLRFIFDLPLFVLYQKIRFDWFPIEALFREWRSAPKNWHD